LPGVAVGGHGYWGTTCEPLGWTRTAFGTSRECRRARKDKIPLPYPTCRTDHRRIRLTNTDWRCRATAAAPQDQPLSLDFPQRGRRVGSAILTIGCRNFHHDPAKHHAQPARGPVGQQPCGLPEQMPHKNPRPSTASAHLPPLSVGAGARKIRPRFGAVWQTRQRRRDRTVHPDHERGVHRAKPRPLGQAAFFAQVSLFAVWFNRHRAHTALGGRTPKERYRRIPAACRRPRFEPRPDGRLPQAVPRRRRRFAAIRAPACNSTWTGSPARSICHRHAEARGVAETLAELLGATAPRGLDARVNTPRRSRSSRPYAARSLVQL